MAIADYNLGGLRALVKFRLQNDPRYSSSLVDLALKLAVTRLMLFIRSTTSIMQATTFVLPDGPDAGKYAMEYPLPDGTLWVDSLSFDGQRPMPVMDQSELANTGAGSPNSGNGVGDPFECYIYDTPERIKVAVLYPRPGRAATLEFWGGVEAIWQANGDDSIPPFREEYGDALVAFARAWLVDGQEGQEEKYDIIFKKWMEERSEAKFNQRVNRISKTRRVRDFT